MLPGERAPPESLSLVMAQGSCDLFSHVVDRIMNLTLLYFTSESARWDLQRHKLPVYCRQPCTVQSKSSFLTPVYIYWDNTGSLLGIVSSAQLPPEDLRPLSIKPFLDF